MNLRQAISSIKKNIHDSCYNKKPFTMLRCSKTCGCVPGIKWDDVTHDGTIIKIKNGHQFRISIETSNSIEDEWQKLIQPERINQTWDDRIFKYKFPNKRK